MHYLVRDRHSSLGLTRKGKEFAYFREEVSSLSAHLWFSATLLSGDVPSPQRPSLKAMRKGY